LPKALTGIRGLDEITRGGLPKGRPTLVCGGPGSGKTLLALTFLVNGALQFDEPGVLMTFEENEEEIASDVESLGFRLRELIEAQKLAVDYVRVERSEIEETGEYDLEGLFVRLDHAIRTVGAKRVVLDTIESLFAGLKNDAILRSELRRLFRWLKDQGVTALITGERGDGALTRQGLEEYVSDAVILLDHRVHDQVSTRRLRVVKYRGSHHGTNEYPFLINASGISVLPVSSMALEHQAPLERVSSGVARLDEMLSNQGYYRGSTILVSGTAGTGKTSLAAHFLDAACGRGERCLCFLFEESPQQLLRNMRSIGIDLEPWVAAGLLRFHADRPSRYGLETHLVSMHQVVADFRPAVTVIDPVTNLMTVGTYSDVQAMLTRLIDHLKTANITAMLTSLTPGQTDIERTETTISSLMDTWIVLANDEVGDRHRRGLYVLKSRGMAHSNERCEFVLTNHGLHLLDADAAVHTTSDDANRGSQKGHDRHAVV
ncbi:MAG TPA: circadian clock protein KaiC, partial [Candidatus Limnocylindrales bacterium]|nr:circadian clock protein KaiC [Candidatus Limnocylindrales bacterium]